MASGTHPAVDQALIVTLCPEVPSPTATEATKLDPRRTEFGSSRAWNHSPFTPVKYRGPTVCSSLSPSPK